MSVCRVMATWGRRGIVTSALIGWAALAAASPSAAEIYKWVDESGTVHFTDAPPAAAGAAVEVLPEAPPRPRPPEPARVAPAADDAPRNEATAPSEVEEVVDEAWVEEPELEVEDVGTEIIIESEPDRATRRRANSPRNQPGQPIRQPGPRRGR